MYFNSFIHMLYLAERDIYKSFKDSPEIWDLFNKVREKQNKLLEKFKNKSGLKELYDDLDKAQIEYLGENEFNSYLHGFKTGFALANELFEIKK